MDSMIIKASTPLFEGFSTSMLFAMLLLLNSKMVHGLSNVFMDELFSLLQKELLPKGNTKLITTYEAFTLIKELGLNYDSIQSCTNGCVLFKGTLKHSRVCPKSNTNRFVDNSQSVPRKVL